MAQSLSKLYIHLIFHKKMTFKEELIAFLKEYGIDYDERYLWSD